MLPRFQRIFTLLALPTTLLIVYFLTKTVSLHRMLTRTLPAGNTANPTHFHSSKPIYKPPLNTTAHPPIVDNFPLGARAKSPADLPPIPSWNLPPKEHIPEHTPLLIGFTRNWRLLQQVMVSYITAGWPASDIYVVENTSVINSNQLGLLTLQNPFYLDYHRLTQIYGANAITTPTLLTPAQLQNFFLGHAVAQN